MPDSLPPIVWETGAPWGLVAVFVLLLAFGLLVPARSLRARERDWQARLDEANGRATDAQDHAEAWREQTQGLMTLSSRRSDETEKLLDSNKVMEGLLRAVNEQLLTRRSTP